METADIGRILKRNINKGFVYIKRSLSPALASQVAALGVRGVYRQREYHRYYPAGRIAGHLLGFTDVDDNGQEGLELTFDQSALQEEDPFHPVDCRDDPLHIHYHRNYGHVHHNMLPQNMNHLHHQGVQHTQVED